jgi:hypothetical protein
MDKYLHFGASQYFIFDNMIISAVCHWYLSFGRKRSYEAILPIAAMWELIMLIILPLCKIVLAYI